MIRKQLATIRSPLRETEQNVPSQFRKIWGKKVGKRGGASHYLWDGPVCSSLSPKEKKEKLAAAWPTVLRSLSVPKVRRPFRASKRGPHSAAEADAPPRPRPRPPAPRRGSINLFEAERRALFECRGRVHASLLLIQPAYPTLESPGTKYFPFCPESPPPLPSAQPRFHLRTHPVRDSSTLSLGFSLWPTATSEHRGWGQRNRSTLPEKM